MMESVFRCGNCGEVLSVTAMVENGGCRVVYHVQKHICFGGDREREKDTKFCDDCKEEK